MPFILNKTKNRGTRLFTVRVYSYANYVSRLAARSSRKVTVADGLCWMFTLSTTLTYLSLQPIDISTHDTNAIQVNAIMAGVTYSFTWLSVT